MLPIYASLFFLEDFSVIVIHLLAHIHSGFGGSEQEVYQGIVNMLKKVANVNQLHGSRCGHIIGTMAIATNGQVSVFAKLRVVTDTWHKLSVQFKLRSYLFNRLAKVTHEHHDWWT